MKLFTFAHFSIEEMLIATIDILLLIKTFSIKDLLIVKQKVN